VLNAGGGKAVHRDRLAPKAQSVPACRLNPREGRNAVSKLSLIGSLTLGLFAFPAWAQEKPADKPAAPAAPAAPPANAPKWVVACQEDIQKHCLEAAKKGDARPCLADHEKDLTQGCKDAFIKQYRIVQLCSDDIQKLCGGSADGREIAKCFNEKQDQLSPKCKSALTRGSKAYEKTEAKAETAAKTEAKEEAAPAPKKKKAAKTAKEPPK
jgi:hypothetical protein